MGKKQFYRTNAEDREDLIGQMGRKAFLANSYYEGLRDLEVPPFFLFEWRVYLEIRFFAAESITWETILAYCRLRELSLSQGEISAIMRIHGYASEQIRMMREESMKEAKNG